jgi:hypothetical protein
MPWFLRLPGRSFRSLHPRAPFDHWLSAVQFGEPCFEAGQRECVSSKPRPLGEGGYRELAGSVARGEAFVICIRARRRSHERASTGNVGGFFVMAFVGLTLNPHPLKSQNPKGAAPAD